MSFFSDNLYGICIAVLLIWFCLKLKKQFNYFKEKGIPQANQSWKDILKSASMESFVINPLKHYRELHKEMQYVGIFQGFCIPSILIMDTEMVEDVLIKNFSHFHDHGFDQDVGVNPLSGHLFNMRGDKWRTLRNKLVPTFTSGKLKGMIPAMEECSDSLIKDMKKDYSLTQDVHLKTLFSRYTLAVIGVTEFFRKLTTDVFNMRKESGLRRNDFIQLLLELREKGSVDVDVKDLEDDEKENIKDILQSDRNFQLGMTDDLMMAQVYVFIIAGFDNSSYLCAIISYALSKHPEIQQRVREEVRVIKRKYGKIDYSALRDMKLLGACIDEALRLYAPLPVLMRECTQNYTFKNGLKVEKGISVVIPSREIHGDEKYWENPKEFIPERFLQNKIKPGTYMPFGDGPRICIAQRLALIKVKLITAKVLENFAIFPSPKTKEPIEMRMLISSDFVGGSWATFKPLPD